MIKKLRHRLFDTGRSLRQGYHVIQGYEWMEVRIPEAMPLINETLICQQETNNQRI
jgi:hypothetical protein